MDGDRGTIIASILFIELELPCRVSHAPGVIPRFISQNWRVHGKVFSLKPIFSKRFFIHDLETTVLLKGQIP